MRLPLRLCAFARDLFLKPLGLLLVLVCAGSVDAHTNAPARLRISILTPGEIRVDAELAAPARSWSFRNAYAGVLGIAERIEEFQAQDAVVKKAAMGEFRSEHDATRVSYTVKFSAPTPADVSHISWLAGDRGFLMFADLIPLDIQTAAAQFVLPAGWTIASSITPDTNGQYEVLEPEKAVFFVGSSLTKAASTVDGMPVEIVISGKWPFKERDVLKSATTVLEKYLALTGFPLPRQSAIMIAPLPVSDGSTMWKAETRGSTVVLLIDPNPKLKLWKAQLTVIFTHELLHLWVPNSLNYEGDYDWFFEGFTLYTALRTALELKVIDFKEFLNTLGRVYDTYQSHLDDDLSLIDASERRWTSSGSPVYVKGMLVAFLYDLMIRKESGGTTTLADRYRELFSSHRSARADGNEAIIALLGSTPALRDFTKSYVESNTRVELERLLPAYGLSAELTAKGRKLRVIREFTEDQKRLLRSLGYRD